MNTMVSTQSRAPSLQRCGALPGATCPCHRQRNALSRYRSEAWSDLQRIPGVVQQAIGSSGQPIDGAARRRLERHFGRDFSGIRVHDGSLAAQAAKAVNARAFTVGGDVVFGAGQYAPRSAGGLKLLAHEVAHSIQQQGSISSTIQSLSLDDQAGQAEKEAQQAAAAFGTGGSADTDRPAPREPLPIGPTTGAIQRHLDAPCPPWVSISAYPRDVWMTANQAIELAYKNSEEHSSHRPEILSGSDFEYGGNRSVGLPQGAAGGAAANSFLAKFLGIRRQLAPDIIDFRERVIYEIKTLGGAVAGIGQLAASYLLAGSLERELGGPPWNRDLANWYPPHVMPYLNRPDRVICTEATAHVGPAQGLILYEVLEKLDEDEQKRKRQRQVQVKPELTGTPVITSVYPELQTYLPAMREEFERKFKTRPVGDNYVIVASRDLYIKLVGDPRMERTLELMRVRGLEPRRNPVIGYHNLWVTLVGIYAALEATVVVAPFALELAAGAGGGAAVAEGVAAAEGGAEVISLAAARAAASAPAVTDAAKAAAVLLVAWVGLRSSSAAATPFETKDVGTVEAVPVGALTLDPSARLTLGTNISYAGKPFVVVGAAQVPAAIPTSKQR